MNIRRILFSGVIAIILLADAVYAASELPSGVVVTVSMSKASFDVDEKIMATVVYSNVSKQSVKLLKWETALSGGITEDLFSVQYRGNEIPYQGIHAKRLPPVAKDYVSLAPGQSATGSLNLLRSYPIDYKGSYEVSLRNSGTSTKSGALAQKAVKPLTINLRSDRPIRILKRRPNFSNCSADQISSTDAALSSAERIANRAIADLRGAPLALRPNARRYREWFGAYTAGRYAVVERNMARIASTLSNQTIGFDCDCTGEPGIDPNNTFAFVFTNDPFNMTLCGAYFRARREGTDSKSGTIVHEVSHFNVVAATRDFRSNQAGIRDLARSSPSDAIRSANAYEYFAENTPFLSMPASNATSPDLAVVPVTVSNLAPRVGQQVVASGSVANQGGAAASATALNLRLVSASDTLQLGSISVPALVQGGSFGFQLDFRTPNNPGEYLVEFCASAVSGESNTGNNCSTISPFLIKSSSAITPILPLLLDD